MHSATPTREMSPSELAKCRENLKRQWENRQVDEALLQRAWEAAYRVATVLYEDYGAAKVAVFGSLAERERFTKESDIDIAVWGLSYNKCLEALWKTEGLSTEFKIDFIDFESSNRLFRKRILDQAIPINKDETDVLKLMHKTNTTTDIGIGEIYRVNSGRLIQRIADERTKIDRTLGSIMELLQEIEVATPHHRKFFEELTAKKLAQVYSGIERIFERIANEIDKHLPKGERWHTDLLTQMAAR